MVAEPGAGGEDFLVAEVGEVGRRSGFGGAVAMAVEDVQTQDSLGLSERQRCTGEKESVKHHCKQLQREITAESIYSVYAQKWLGILCSNRRRNLPEAAE